MKKLFVFGLGYSATLFARRKMAEGWTVMGTCRSVEKQASLIVEGIQAHVMHPDYPLESFGGLLDSTTHILHSIPPGSDGDIVHRLLRDEIMSLDSLEWFGYLSTTGVYGNLDGGVAHEKTPRNPTSTRSKARVVAEDQWMDLFNSHGLPVHLFRLAGIYGPGRNTLETVRRGEARRIIKPGHKFSRIHVEDICNVLQASVATPNPGTAYNVCDIEPAAPADVTAFACELLGVSPPEPVAFETARETMSPMARTFWQDNKTLDTTRLREDLGVELAYPTYRDGLRALL